MYKIQARKGDFNMYTVRFQLELNASVKRNRV